METKITKNIKYALYLNCLGRNGRTDLVKRYCATEVGLFVERSPQHFKRELIDFITYKDGEIRCYEIKQSLSDLKSSHALTFIGNFNYLVVPNGFYNKYKYEIDKKLEKGIGVIEVIDNKVKYIKKAVYRQVEDNVKLRVMDSMITSMFYKMQYNKKY